MADWLDALTMLDAAGESAVLVTVLSARGSTPREAGCKMVVSRDALFGTIGGGTLEHRCMAEARSLLAGPATAPSVHDFPLGPALGQCCGGHVSVLFETFRPATMQIALFGAGHVGRAVVRLLGELPCQITWIDPRPDAFPASLPSNTTSRSAVDIATLAPGTQVLVMTHDHQCDFDIVAAALERADLGGVGLIGSVTKRARFVARLRRAGLGPDAIDRLECPIGLPGIDSKLPAAIAISIAARLLARHPAPPSPQAPACQACARHPEGVCV